MKLDYYYRCGEKVCLGDEVSYSFASATIVGVCGVNGDAEVREDYKWVLSTGRSRIWLEFSNDAVLLLDDVDEDLVLMKRLESGIV